MASISKKLRRSSLFEDTADDFRSAARGIRNELDRPRIKRTGLILVAIVGIAALYWMAPEIRRELKMMSM